MSVRQYEFIVGPETSTLPTVTDAVADGDIASYGQIQTEFTARSTLENSVDDISALRDLLSTTAERIDGQLVWIRDDDTFYEWDEASSASDDGDITIEPDDAPVTGRWIKMDMGGGGGGGGGGSEMTDIVRGETITAGDTVFLWRKKYLEVTASNKWIDFNEGGGQLNAQLTVGLYLFDTTANIAEFTAMVKAAIDLVKGGGVTYTISFSNSTRKITLASSGNVSWLWKTGTHGSDNTDTHAGTLMGFSDAADDTSVTTNAADNTIDGTLSSNYFSYATDADFIEKSRSVMGVDGDGGAKYSGSTISLNTEMEVYTGLSIGEKYTKSAAIVLTSSNNKLDFTRAGTHSATITAGTYYHPYSSLCTLIGSLMTAQDANTYAATYNNDTDKFTITGSAAFTLDFVSGTNNATSIDTKIGFAHVDEASLTSHTSDVALHLKGRLASSTEATQFSALSGIALNSTKLYQKRDEGTRYLQSINNSNLWITNPSSLDKDFTVEIQNIAQHENVDGIGVRVVHDNSGNLYKFQYKTTHGAAWSDSASTFTSSGTIITENFAGTGGYANKGYVFVDENGKCLFVYNKWNSGNSVAEVWGAYSNDGGATWTACKSGAALASNASVSFYTGGIYIRQNKAAILLAIDSDAGGVIQLSDYSSGYTMSSTTVVSISGVFAIEYATSYGIFLQYFPAESGANQYRVVACVRNASNSIPYYFWAKGDGSGTGNAAMSSSTGVPQSAGMDQQGNANRILTIIRDTAVTTKIKQAETNEDYNSGTLTVNNHSNQDIGGGGTNSLYNGNTSNSSLSGKWNSDKRVLVIGSKAFGISETDSGQKLWLYYTSSITGGTWSATQVGFLSNSSAEIMGEYCLFYVAAAQEVIILFKQSTGTANNFTTGAIYAQRVILNGDGTITILSKEQIDGGLTVGSQFQGYLTGSTTALGITASWEHYNGSTRDTLWTNKYF